MDARGQENFQEFGGFVESTRNWCPLRGTLRSTLRSTLRGTELIQL
jgi:hypothetical protein